MLRRPKHLAQRRPSRGRRAFARIGSTALAVAICGVLAGAWLFAGTSDSTEAQIPVSSHGALPVAAGPDIPSVGSVPRVGDVSQRSGPAAPAEHAAKPAPSANQAPGAKPAPQAGRTPVAGPKAATTVGSAKTVKPAVPPKVKPAKPAKPKDTLAPALRRGCPITAQACVNIDAKLTWLQKNGKVIVGPVKMMTGRPGHPTPRGTFKVLRKDADHISNIYYAPMPYSVFFTDDGIAFHEGPLDGASHGCVHLTMAEAKIFYNALHIGDTVVVA